MDKTGCKFQYVRSEFPNVGETKIKKGIFVGPQIRKLMQDKQFDVDLNKTERNVWLSFKRIYKDFLRKSQSSKLSGCCAGPADFVRSYGMQYESEYPFSGVTLGIFPRKSQRSQWRTWWKISPRHYGYGKAVPRQVDLNYFGRLLQETEEGRTWCQILSKVIHLYSLEESFCLFHVHVKYYVVHLNSSVSLKPCLTGKVCIHIWIQHKKYCWVHLLKFVGQKKKLNFVDQCNLNSGKGCYDCWNCAKPRFCSS